MVPKVGGGWSLALAAAMAPAEACARGTRHGGACARARGDMGRLYSQPPFASKQERDGAGT
jgi:uncharacterized membrane protein